MDDIPDGKYFKRQNKNAIKVIDLNIASYQYFDGVDILAIPGVSHSTVLTLMSEIGPEGFSKFPTAQHFASWLKLAPNNKISGGRVLSNRIPQESNRLKIALRNAANAVGNLKDSDLAKFFRKIAFKKGRQTAINATARKSAVILWNMVTKKQQYMPKNNYLFLDQKRKIVSRMRKQIADLGLNPDDLGFSRANRDKISAQMTSDNQSLSLR
ncbi:MAG: transposase [Cyclobacteriaceae bacterium]